MGIPSHLDIPGNDRADDLATSKAMEDLIDIYFEDSAQHACNYEVVEYTKKDAYNIINQTAKNSLPSYQNISPHKIPNLPPHKRQMFIALTTNKTPNPLLCSCNNTDKLTLDHIMSSCTEHT